MAWTVREVLRRLRGASNAWSGAVPLALLSLLAPPSTADAAVKRFEPIPGSPIPRERLFDVGAVDYDRDGFIDLFTTNHKFHPVVLRNRGGEGFEDVTGSAGLSPTPQFPGYENLRAPAFDRPGVYFWATDPKGEKMPGFLHVRSVGVSAQLNLSFGADSATLQSIEGGSQVQGRTPGGQPIIYLSLDPGGTADIQASHLDLPVSVDFTSPVIPGSPGLPPIIPPTDPTEVGLPPIYVGTNAVPAPGNFALTLRDRHGYAWADVVGDSGMDAFVTTGGLGGAIKLPDYETTVLDELLVQEPGGKFHDGAAASGLTKRGCRGRQSAAVDANADGLVDLFETCSGDPPSLFLQRAKGGFRSVKSPRTSGGTYRWIPLSGGRPSLLSAEARGTRVLQYTPAGRWRSLQTVPVDARNGDVAQFATADVDTDGDLDVLAVSRTGNTLLENEGGTLENNTLKGTGIPGASVAASFVDYDNDGRLDLDLIPQGIQRGVGGGRFRGTGMLRVRGRPGAGTTTWADLDNDGLRDPIRVTANAEFARRKGVTQSKNAGPGGHWLEVDLRGRPGNREAIGAWVELKAGSRSLVQWVGQNDDSHYSQGHYRLYFGLGGRSQVRDVVVHWPNGDTTRLGTFEADRVVEIAQGGN